MQKVANDNRRPETIDDTLARWGAQFCASWDQAQRTAEEAQRAARRKWWRRKFTFWRPPSSPAA